MEEEKVEMGSPRPKGSIRSSARSSGRGEDSMRSSVLEQGEVRCQAVFLRHEDEIDAMGSFDRFKTRVKSLGRRICCLGSPTSPGKKDDDADGEEHHDRQYRLEAAQTTPRNRWTLWTQGTTVTNAGSLGVTPNQALALYLHWMFRVNFFFLFTLSCVVFFALVMLFSFLILLAGWMDPKCVRIGGEEIGVNGAEFADAFALSWTTFSTVGYGSTYPALGHENENPSNCMLITVICSLESFIGVLYSGFCGAILFGKVLRIQSHASVMFSDPIVIRYGSGVVDTGEDSEDEEVEEGLDYLEQGERQGPLQTHSKIPCPVLEFRIVNRLYNETGGEIMDATLNVVANVDANDADIRVDRDPLTYSDSKDTLRSMGSDISNRTGGSLSGGRSALSARSAYANQSMRSIRNGAWATILGQPISVDEDHTGQIISKRIFSKMRIEAQEHPFFKRVWLAKHVLDESSPVLTPRARRLVRKNKGHWPAQLNDASGVRRSIKFNQILVSLNGVSNVSAADVYAQKIYDFVDVNIGYQFVNLLYRDEHDMLRVDTELINDVREQNGGGGETLTVPEDGDSPNQGPSRSS